MGDRKVKLLLDSVIFIDHFNNILSATHFIAKYQADIGISCVTRAEILTGFESKSQMRLAQRLLDQFTQYPLTKVEADLAALLRRQYRWKLPDAFQAAIAKHHGLKLVTRNIKDFDPKKHDFVMLPYEV